MLQDVHTLIQHLVRTLVALVQAPVDLVQAHPPQGRLIWVVSRQDVVGPGFGLIGAVWWVFAREGFLFTGCAWVGVGLVVSVPRG